MLARSNQSGGSSGVANNSGKIEIFNASSTLAKDLMHTELKREPIRSGSGSRSVRRSLPHKREIGQCRLLPRTKIKLVCSSSSADLHVIC